MATGTSLTEQILANHSMVHAMGELPTLGELLFSSVGNFPHGLLQLDHEAWHQLGWKYLDHVRRLSGGSAFITDKMPFNFLYTGFIRLMLPQAIVVDCRRNALDTCLSCFKSYFVDRSLAYTGGGLARLLEWSRMPGDLVFIVFGVVPIVIVAVRG